MESPEALTIRNQIRLASHVDQIGARAARLLERSAVRMARQLQATRGLATSQALQAQLAHIQGILQQAGVASYQQFVDDLTKQLSTWQGMAEKEARAAVTSAIDQGLKLNETALAGPAAGMGVNTAGATVFGEQALRTASTMGSLELTVLGAQGKKTYSLESEFAKAFLSPNGKTLQDGFKAAADQLQSIFDGAVKSAVVTGQTTASLTSQLIGDGKKISGQVAPAIRNLQTLARTGAQQVANAVQYDQLQVNPAIDQVIYVATLDQRTTPLCQSLDGKVFPIDKAPRPPLHWNCRSTVTAYLPGSEQGARSMTMAIVEDDGSVRYVGAFDKKIQDRLTDAQKALLERNRSGKGVTYQDWLKAQPTRAQQLILGKKGAATFAKTGSLIKAAPLPVKNQLKTIVPKVPAKAKPKAVIAPAAAPKAQAKAKPAAASAKPATAAAAKPVTSSPAKPAAAPAKPASAAPAKPAPAAAAPLKAPKSQAAPAQPKLTKVQQMQADSKALLANDPELAVYKGMPIAKNSILPGKYPMPQIILDQVAPEDMDAWLQMWHKMDAASQKILLKNYTGLASKPAPVISVPAAPVKPAPAKTKKAVAAQQKAGKLKSENLPATATGKTTTDNVFADFDETDLGTNGNNVRRMQNAVRSWSGNGYDDMRPVQVLQAEQRGVALTKYEQGLADSAKGYGSYLKQFEEKVAAAEEYISRAPKYKGQIQRGIGLRNQSEFNEFVAKIQSGEEVLTMESWSTSPNKAVEFASKNHRDIEVVMVVQDNVHGAPMAAISSFRDEEEVLMPSRVRYRLIDQTQDAPKNGLVRWTLLLEQLP